MQLLVAHRGDGDERHVERVEGGIMFDPYESQRSAGEDEQDSAAQYDDPVAKAAHSVAILAGLRSYRLDLGKTRLSRLYQFGRVHLSQSLRTTSTVMSSESSGTPVHCRTLSITVSMIWASSRSTFFATSSMRRSSPNISPYS